MKGKFRKCPIEVQAYRTREYEIERKRRLSMANWLKSEGAMVLLPIRPEFADAILNGEKRIEFRKRPFGRYVSYIVIYSTKPVSKMVGAFEVLGVEEDSPSRLWARYHDVSGISESSFFRYYADTPCGVAIRIGRVWRFNPPVELHELEENLHPSPNYVYFLWDERTRLNAITTWTEIRCA